MLNVKTTRQRLTVLAVLSLVLLALPLVAVGEEKLPSAAQVIEDYIEATGGKKAYEKHQNMKITGTFSMPAMGITAPLTSYQAAPNLGYTLIESQAFGTIESGSDGTVTWEKTMMAGGKIKEGEEKAVADRQGTFNLLLEWEKFYTSAETTGQEEVDGRMCNVIVMTPKEGSPETSWYDVETKLLVKTSFSMTTDMGNVSMDSYPSDYREVDGVLVPFNAKQVLMGVQEMVITTESLEWDVEIPQGIFDLPEDIKALMK